MIIKLSVFSVIFRRKYFNYPHFVLFFFCWKTTQPIIIHLTNFNVICASFTSATAQNMKFPLKNFFSKFE